MAKKFDAAKVQTGRAVNTQLARATSTKGQQGEASPQEAAERAEERKTQGRKGCRASRINMAFSPSNDEFLRVASRASGKTITEFANLVIAAYQREHPEILEQARGFLDAVSILTQNTADKE